MAEGPDFQRHRDDPYSHGPLVNRLELEWEGRWVERNRTMNEKLANHETRISSTERFQLLATGGLIVIGAMIGGGLLTLILRLAGVFH